MDQHELNKIKQVFDNSVRDIDPATLQELRTARQRALHAAAKPIGTARHIGALAMAASVIVAVVLLYKPAGPRLDVQGVSEFELLLEDDELELYENLEFYSWLAVANGDAG